MKTRKIFQNNDTKRNVLNFFIKFFFESLSLRGKSGMIKKFFFESLSLRGKSGMAIIISICAFMIFAFRLSENHPKKNNSNSIISFPSDSNTMDINNIRAWYRSNGSFNRDPVSENAGFYWPNGTALTARYESGLWIGGIVGGDTLVTINEYLYTGHEFVPGYIDQNGIPQGKDDSLYRIYKINRGETSDFDYLNWPFEQGAYKDENGKPFLMGDQTMFFSYTDGYPETHTNNAGRTAPLNAQILQTNWAFNKSYGFLSDVIITDVRIINRGNITWERFYIGLWTDDDIGLSTTDAVGCDTVLNLGYTYNYNAADPVYGADPPAVGFIFLKGLMMESDEDTVKYSSPPMSSNLIIKSGFKDLGMTSYNMFTGDNPSFGDPGNYREAYYNLQGIRRDGTYFTNPTTNQITKFAFSGDPYTQTGWHELEAGDRRSLMCSGPTTVNPGDTQTVVYAQIISRGGSNRESVQTLRNNSRYLKNFYDNNFEISLTPVPPAAKTYSSGNGKVYLSWNDSAETAKYLNKFTDKYTVFQGYNIYQVSSYSTHPTDNDTLLLKTFDIIDGVKDIRDSVYLNGYEGFIYGIVQKGSDNGISRYIELDKDFIGNQNFVTGAEYKFCVTAYYYDSTGGPYTLPKVIESPKTVLKIIPQNLSSGTQINYSYGDTILTDQKDLAVMPVIIDPLKLLNASYTSVFGVSDSNKLNWTLTRKINGMSETLFENVENFYGTQDTAKSADGLMFIHKLIRDSGIVRDVNDPENLNIERTNITKGWTYEPEGKEWFTAPDTTAVKTAKYITNRQFDSRSLGMSFPTIGKFNNFRSRIFANGNSLTPGTGQNTLLTGGPLRKIKIVFGENSKAYRYAPSENILLKDSNLLITPFADIKEVPFSVYAVDELDSTQENPRRLNIGFVDADANGLWDPDDSPLGKYQFTYIFTSDYRETPDQQYMTNSGQIVNPGIANPLFGFSSLDIMYAWLPRVKNVTGVKQTWQNGDVLTVYPYRISRADFVPGYPVKYSWTISGTTFNNTQLAAANLNNIKAFPNPYYGFSSLEFNDAGEKIIYFSNLPAVCDIFIYSLDGSLVKQINRNTNNPNSSLEKWDIKNNGGEYVASGMYIVYVDCKDAGAKTLKIAVFQSR